MNIRQKWRQFSWRWRGRIILLLFLIVTGFYAFFIEPYWLRLVTIKLSSSPTTRIVHISDIHYKGDRPFLSKVITEINNLKPDLVCFTGDLMEDKKYLPEILELLSRIKAPLIGVPGNHDYWSDADFSAINKAFAARGGKWLVDDSCIYGNLVFIGTVDSPKIMKHQQNSRKKILLCHYPAIVDQLPAKEKFDLILAGHSHGGQIRLPFYGALIVPAGTGRYDKGLYHTEHGPLYVNPGLGYWMIPARFCCWPEITTFKL